MNFSRNFNANLISSITCYAFPQLGRIYLDMLNVYKCMSENISGAIQQNGVQVTKQPVIRSMRTVKKETLKLISGWVSRSNDPQMVRLTSSFFCEEKKICICLQ